MGREKESHSLPEDWNEDENEVETKINTTGSALSVT